MNSDLYEALSASIDLYALDVAGEGFSVDIYSASGGTPEELRSFLQGLYGSGLEGCVFIGDLPIAWYEMYGCYDPPYQEEFPCDMFYMDMNGVFEDTDADGLYDLHTGDRAPDIWLGRLTASPLTMGGSTEIELLENYFRKNHLYRCNLAPLANHGLAYSDDECAFLSYTLYILMTEFIGGCTAVDDPWTTWDTDYENRLTVPYELVQVWAHSSPASHAFTNPAQEWSYTENWEIQAIDPVAYFYILGACSNARYTSVDYMAGWYVFSQNYGLAAFGSTKAGALNYPHDIYPSLGRQEPIGRAYLNWFLAQAAGGFWRWQECYYYGLTLIGDPTLRLQEKSDSKMIQYDNEWGGSSSCLPNNDGLDLFNTRFTAGKSCSLSTILMLANPWSGAPTCRVYVWNSDGTFPTDKIDSIDVPLNPANIGRWTTVDVSELGVQFSEGEDFHVGFTAINLQPGERVDVHAGEWVDSLPVRSSVMHNGSWIMWDDLVPGGHNFDIRVIVVEEPEPEVDITTLTIPNANVDGYYHKTLEAAGGVPPYLWDLTAGSLPQSITLDSGTGAISGQPLSVDTAHFTVRVRDNSATPLTDIQHLTLITQMCVDSDGDGFGDPGHSNNGCLDDNCPHVHNPGQEDADGDGIGDACASTCCTGLTMGNVDCAGIVDIGDVTKLIQKLFITLDTFCCEDEADLDRTGLIDIGDLTLLISSLFIIIEPPASCMDADWMCYFGFAPPDMEAEPFAPDVLSTDHCPHSAPAISPDCSEIYWSAFGEPPAGGTFYSTFDGTSLSLPAFPSFLDEGQGSQLAFADDGGRLFYSATQPLPNDPDSTVAGIWSVERSGTGWSERQLVTHSNDSMYIGTLSLTRNGIIYFGGRIKTEPYPGIFLIRPVDGEYGPIEAVEIADAAADQADVYVDPDERYMLFSSYFENPGNGIDLYISRRQPDSSWGAPISLGSAVNTVNSERFPYVSRDGQRLFFVRSMGSEYCAEDTKYYWISAEILDGLGN